MTTLELIVFRQAEYTLASHVVGVTQATLDEAMTRGEVSRRYFLEKERDEARGLLQLAYTQLQAAVDQLRREYKELQAMTTEWRDRTSMGR